MWKGAIAFLLLATIVACSIVVSSDREQCTTDADCRSFAADAVCIANACTPPTGAADASTLDADASDPKWDCLGRVVPIVEDRARTVDTQFRIYDIGDKPRPDIPLKLCTFIDIPCRNPLAGPFVTDALGVVKMSLHHGFRGYVDIGASASTPDLTPSLFYVPAVNADAGIEQTYGVTVPSKSQLSVIAAQAGKPVNPALGHILFLVYDCQNGSGPGVIVRTETTGSETYTFYMDQNGVPSATQEETSSFSVGGVMNLPPGVVTMSYSRAGQRVGSQNVIIRESSMSYVSASPTP